MTAERRRAREVLVFSLIRTMLVFINSYVAMLCIGAGHSYDRRIPAFGYWATFWLAFALYAVLTSKDPIEDKR